MARIHCILLTKNEADIIEMCLSETSKWAHKIYVYDGASTDGTWKKVRAMVSDIVVAWKSEDRVFQEDLRLDVFDAFRQDMRPGDWVCQLNADEFYVENPAQFLDSLKPSSQVVWGNSIEYYLTDVDVAALDFNRPMPEILSAFKHYKCFNSERRFFQYRKGLVWEHPNAWPFHLGIVEKRRIAFRHYPYRTPASIQQRLDRRRESRALGFKGGDHDNFVSWKEKIVDHKTLACAQGDAAILVDESKLPVHLPPLWQQLVQRVMHGTGIWP